MMTMKTAIVGLGPQGRRLVQVVKNHPGLELAAVCDLSPKALDSAELAGTSALRTVSLAELLAVPDLGLLCITTHAPSHPDIAIQAMEAGVRRIMVEKPMGCSAADCDRMIAVAARTGSRLAVNQSRRHEPFYRWLRDHIASGAWGQLRTLWIQRPGIGLGCLGTHYFDLVRFLGAGEVSAVTAWVDPFIGPNPRGAHFADPGGTVVMQMSSGARAVIAQIEDGAGPMSIELDLTGARIRIDEHSGHVEIIERDLTVKPGPGRPPVYAPGKVPEGLKATPNAAVNLKNLLDELLHEGPMDCDAVHGMVSIEVLVAAHLSHQRGHVPVVFPLAAAADRAVALTVT